MADQINRLAAGVDVIEVFELVAQVALACVNDMVTDRLCDPEYAKTCGLPTKESIAEMAIDHILNVMPNACDDELDMYGIERRDNEPLYVFIMRKAIAKRMVQDPTLLNFEYTAR